MFIEFTNRQSGSAYPCDISPFSLTDSLGGTHNLSAPLSLERSASLNAGWQFQAASVWKKFNPGEVLGTVEAFDLPGGAGDIFLHLGGHTVYLGNFDEMPLEE